MSFLGARIIMSLALLQFAFMAKFVCQSVSSLFIRVTHLTLLRRPLSIYVRLEKTTRWASMSSDDVPTDWRVSCLFDSQRDRQLDRWTIACSNFNGDPRPLSIFGHIFDREHNVGLAGLSFLDQAIWSGARGSQSGINRADATKTKWFRGSSKRCVLNLFEFSSCWGRT